MPINTRRQISWGSIILLAILMLIRWLDQPIPAEYQMGPDTITLSPRRILPTRAQVKEDHGTVHYSLKGDKVVSVQFTDSDGASVFINYTYTDTEWELRESRYAGGGHRSAVARGIRIDAQRRQEAEELLRAAVNWREPLDAAIGYLDAKDPYLRYVSARFLGDMGPAATEAIPVLTASLHDDEWFVRGTAAEALGRIGSSQTDIQSALVRALNDDVPYVRYSAALALGRVGTVGTDASEALLGVLDDPDWLVRQNAASALGYLGPGHPGVIPALIQSLADTGEVSGASAEALRAIGTGAVPSLVGALQESSERDRVRIIGVLEQFGADAAPAIPHLVPLLADQDSATYSAASSALVSIGRAAIPELLDALEQASPGAAAHIPSILVGIGTEGLDLLVEALSDGREVVRRYAAQAVSHFGPDAAGAVPPLIQLLNDESSHVRQHAAEALGNMGELASVAAPNLAERLTDPEPRVLDAAMLALGRIGAGALPTLMEYLEAEHPPYVYARVAQVLAALGCAAEPAVPLLEPFRDHPNSDVRDQVMRAIEAITAEAVC